MCILFVLRAFVKRLIHWRSLWRHRPLRQAPAVGTLVYLVSPTEGYKVRAIRYREGDHKALREGRIFAYKEDALVWYYGIHYSTIK